MTPYSGNTEALSFVSESQAERPKPSHQPTLPSVHGSQHNKKFQLQDSKFCLHLIVPIPGSYRNRALPSGYRSIREDGFCRSMIDIAMKGRN